MAIVALVPGAREGPSPSIAGPPAGERSLTLVVFLLHQRGPDYREIFITKADTIDKALSDLPVSYTEELLLGTTSDEMFDKIARGDYVFYVQIGKFNPK